MKNARRDNVNPITYINAPPIEQNNPPAYSVRRMAQYQSGPTIEDQPARTPLGPGTRQSEAKEYGKMQEYGGGMNEMGRLNNPQQHREMKDMGFNIITGANQKYGRPF